MCIPRTLRTFLESQDVLAGAHKFKRCAFKVEVGIDFRSELGGQLARFGYRAGERIMSIKILTKIEVGLRVCIVERVQPCLICLFWEVFQPFQVQQGLCCAQSNVWLPACHSAPLCHFLDSAHRQPVVTR